MKLIAFKQTNGKKSDVLRFFINNKLKAIL